MKKLIISLVLLIQGCGVYECIDMKFSRTPEPIDKVYNIDLKFNDTKMNMGIQCEKYYEAMCAERGNYWTLREVGKEKYFETSNFKFIDPKLGSVSIPIPNCSDMVNDRTTSLNYIIPKINGESYWLKSSNKNIRTLSTGSNHFNKNEPIKTITVDWELKVNDKSLE
jgi:hypothetical protein